MKNQSRYDQDRFEVYATIHEATETLGENMPTELIAAILLHEAKAQIEKLDEFEQWEVIKPEALDILGEITLNVEPRWSNVEDRDEIAESYDRRYG